MIRPDFEKWQQRAAEIREKSIEADHKRSRERFQALYMIGTEQCNASQWARTIKRCVQTVLKWVHTYNEQGPTALDYRHSGGRQPKMSEADKDNTNSNYILRKVAVSGHGPTVWIASIR